MSSIEEILDFSKEEVLKRMLEENIQMTETDIYHNMIVNYSQYDDFNEDEKKLVVSKKFAKAFPPYIEINSKEEKPYKEALKLAYSIGDLDLEGPQYMEENLIKEIIEYDLDFSRIFLKNTNITRLVNFKSFKQTKNLISLSLEGNNSLKEINLNYLPSNLADFECYDNISINLIGSFPKNIRTILVENASYYDILERIHGCDKLNILVFRNCIDKDLDFNNLPLPKTKKNFSLSSTSPSYFTLFCNLNEDSDEED